MSNITIKTDKIIAIMLWLVVMMPIVSCSSSNDEPISPGEESSESYRISFTIGSDSVVSRSEVVYTPGVDMESYIRDMRMYIFVDGKFFENINVISFAQTDYNSDKYIVSASIAKIPTKDFSVMVLANMDSSGSVTNYYPSMNSGTTMQGVVQWNCYFKYHDTAIGRNRLYEPYRPSSTLPIPMYGVKEYAINDLYFDKELATDMGEMNVVRAIAKVILNSENEGITNVVLSQSKVGGMGCPLGMYDNTSYPENGNINVPNTVNYYKSTGDIYDLPFDEIEDGKSYQIYLPESYNSSTHAYLTFLYKGIEYKVELKDYETGEYFDILRNHCYRFDVTITEYPTINVKYSVSSWNKKSTSEIIFD